LRERQKELTVPQTKAAPPEAPVVAGDMTRLSTAELYLDYRNPRLVGEAGKTDQLKLIETLWKNESLDELALSIAQNGFFNEEPLLVVKEEGNLVVVEGNRRLATVKLLLNDELRRKLRATDLPSLTPTQKAELDTLPVSIYPDRKSLWAYIGFRHVNGPLTWDSWPKAQYIAFVRDTFGIDLDQIALSIGDKNQTVKRLYRGLMVLNQATEQADYRLEDRHKKHLSFSHLYTGLDYAGFQQHLGLGKDAGYNPNPIPPEYLPNLKELMIWLFGSRDEGKLPVVKSQNPDLKKLDDVLKDKNGLTALRAGLGLEVAYQLSLGDEIRFRECLTRCKYELQQAKGLVITGYKGERDLLDLVDEITDIAQSLADEMRAKNRQSRQTARASG
jgi:hypothetical protein